MASFVTKPAQFQRRRSEKCFSSQQPKMTAQQLKITVKIDNIVWDKIWQQHTYNKTYINIFCTFPITLRFSWVIFFNFAEKLRRYNEFFFLISRKFYRYIFKEILRMLQIIANRLSIEKILQKFDILFPAQTLRNVQSFKKIDRRRNRNLSFILKYLFPLTSDNFQKPGGIYEERNSRVTFFVYSTGVLTSVTLRWVHRVFSPGVTFFVYSTGFLKFYDVGAKKYFKIKPKFLLYPSVKFFKTSHIS